MSTTSTRKRGRPRKKVTDDDMDIDIIDLPRQRRKTNNTARNAVVASSVAAGLTGLASVLMKLGYIPSDRESVANALSQGFQFTRQKAKEQLLDPEFSTMQQEMNSMSARMDDFQNAGMSLENQFRELVSTLEQQNLISVNN